jgi:glycosyltransferase involved in cell wall biosynthesis
VSPVLSVVVPVFNERDTLEHLLARVEAVPLSKEIILVDDGSTDGTRDLLQRYMTRPGYHVVLQARNQGKGSALREGFRHATGQVVVVQDADLEYDPAEYPKLIQPILDDLADVVYGSRFAGSPRRVLYFWHSVGNKFLTLVSNMLTDLNLTDMETCYKVFRREIIQGMPLRSQRFGFEPEITVKLAKAKYRIYEVPISYAGRTYEEGKKIGWKDAVDAMWTLFYFAFLDRTPIPRATLTRLIPSAAPLDAKATQERPHGASES